MAAQLGSLGGKAVVKKFGKGHMLEISKKATRARRKKAKLNNK